MDTWRLAFRSESLPDRLPEAEALGLPVIALLTGSSGQDNATINPAVIRSRGSRRRARFGALALIERRWGIARMIRETPAASGETDPTGMGIPS